VAAALAILALIGVSAGAADQTVTGNMTVTGTTVISDTTASTSKDSGALVVEGGVGVEGSLFAGGNISATMLIASGGSLTSATGTDLTLTSGTGPTQNVILKPSYNGEARADFHDGASIAFRFAGSSGSTITFNGDSNTYLRNVGGTNEIMEIGTKAGGIIVFSAANAEGARMSPLKNFLIGGTTEMAGSGGLKVFGSTAATGTTSGSLINAGGFGNAGAAYFGGTLNANATVRVTGANQSPATSTSILDYSAGTARLISYGANATTPGAFSLIGISSDGSISGERLGINSAGAVNIPNALTVGGLLNTNATLRVTGTNATHATGTTIIDNFSGAARVLSYGPNATTPGAFSFMGLSNDGSVSSERLGISPTGTVNIPAALVVGGNMSVAGSLTAPGNANLTLGAGTGNQNVVLNPSGTGYVQLGGNVSVAGASVSMASATFFQPTSSEFTQKRVVNFSPTTAGWYRILNSSSSILPGYGKFGRVTIHYSDSIGNAVYEVSYGTAAYSTINSLTLVNAWRYNTAEPRQIRASSSPSTVDSGIDIYLQTIGTNPQIRLVFEGVTGTPVSWPVVGATPYSLSRALDLTTASFATTGTIQGGDQGLTLNAGGTDQNITLAPSGAGNTILNGKVGIGTTTPASKLSVEVNSTGTDRTIATLSNTDTTAFAGLAMKAGAQLGSLVSFAESYPTSAMANSTGVLVGGGATTSYVGSWNDGTVRIHTGAFGNEKVRVDASGSVGIGTTTPSTTNKGPGTSKLDVVGFNGTNVTVQDTTSYAAFIAAGYTEANLVLRATAATSGSQVWSLNDRVGTLSFRRLTDDAQTVTSTPMVITSANNVGIGTTTPTTKLEVAGDVTVGSAASSDGANLRLLSSASPQWNVDNFAGTLRFFTETGYGVGGVERMKLTGNDLWLAGTLTATGLTINGQAFGNPSDYLKTTGTGNLTVTSLTASGGTLAGSSSTGLTLSSGGAGKDLVLDPDGTGTGDVVIPAGNKLKMNGAPSAMRAGEINIGAVTTGSGTEVSLVEFGDASDAGSLRGTVNGTGDTATWKFGYRMRDAQSVDTFAAGLTLATTVTGNATLTAGGGLLKLSPGAADQNILLDTSGTGMTHTERGVGGARQFSLMTDSIQVVTPRNDSNGVYFFREGSADPTGTTWTAYGIRFTDTFDAGSSGYFDWIMGGNSALRIFNNRNFGFGTTTDSGHKLQVNGTTSLGGNTTVTGTLQTSGAATLGGNTSVTGALQASTTGSFGSFVGAGFTNPFAAEIGGSASNGYLKAYTTTGGATAPLSIYGSTLTFGTGLGTGTTALTINGSQQVAVTATTEATTGGAGALTVAGGIFASKKIVTATDLVAGGGLTVATAATFNGGATVSGGPLTANAGVNASALSSGSLTGGTSGLALNAGTADQNVTLAATGTGGVAVAGRGLVVGAATSPVKTAWTGTGYDGFVAFPAASYFSVYSEMSATYRGGGLLSNIARVGNGWSYVDASVPAWRLYLGSGSASDFFTVSRSPSGTFAETTLFKIANDGNVGIGNTAPSAKLEVTGTSKLNGAVTATGDVAITSPTTSTTPTSGALQVTGGVGVAENLNVGGNAVVTGATSIGGDAFVTGSVGIGTSTPTTKLDVIGDGRFSDSLAVNTNGTAAGVLTIGSVGSSNGGNLRLISSGNSWGVENTAGVLVFSKQTATGASKNYIATMAAGSDSSIWFGGRVMTQGLSVATGGITVYSGDLTLSNATIRGLAMPATITGSEAANVNYVNQQIPFAWNTTSHIITLKSNSTDFLGLGTQSPGYKLDVLHTDGARLDGLASGQGLTLRRNAAGGSQAWRVGVGTTNGATTFKISDVTTSNAEKNRLMVTSAGKVGLGTDAPQAPLHVFSEDVASAAGAQLILSAPQSYGNTDGHYILFRNNWSTNDPTAGFAAVGFNDGGSGNGNLWFATAPSSSNRSNTPVKRMFIDGTGNVGIGTSKTTGYRLSVEGSMRAREVVVNSDTWSDYVFDETYRNAPLSEVEEHIKTHKHLPGVPSAQEVADNGVNVGKMQAVLLAKVEELTLHMIEQEKRIKKLETENETLRAGAR
jgi:hypothetical protein